MLDLIGEWATALDLTGLEFLPVWAVVGIATFVVLACVLALARGSTEGRSVLVLVLVLIVALTGWWARDHFGRREFAAQRVLDARVFELAMHASTPGSPLGCLDAIAGETVEAACDKALFASPEATAEAVSYVAAQLSLLASASDLGRHGGPLRRAVEADRFGIVAHVLTVRYGCTPEQCGAFAWLRDTDWIRVNLVERTFEAHIKKHSATWPAADGRQARSNPPSPTPGVAAKVPNNLYFPSAASIPPVNIMIPEPPAAQRQPQDTTGAAESAPPRRTPQAGSQARQPPSSAPARSTPMPLAPAQ